MLRNKNAIMYQQNKVKIKMYEINHTYFNKADNIRSWLMYKVFNVYIIVTRKQPNLH